MEESFADHYLAGRDMPTPVLLLTLFATQYSGNSLFMNTATAYDKGFAYAVMVANPALNLALNPALNLALKPALNLASKIASNTAVKFRSSGW